MAVFLKSRERMYLVSLEDKVTLVFDRYGEFLSDGLDEQDSYFIARSVLTRVFVNAEVVTAGIGVTDARNELDTPTSRPVKTLTRFLDTTSKSGKKVKGRVTYKIYATK